MSFLMGLKDAGITVGSRQLLSDVTVSFDTRSRIGIVGPNGAGKSTLLHMLAGTTQIHQGKRIVTDGVRIATLAQFDTFDQELSIKQAVHGDIDDHEWARHRHLRAIDEGLLEDLDLHLPVETLSGGQKRRVALARCLGSEADIVLLDEPTNHLDVEGVAWLADYLNERFAATKAAGALGVVTHDRWFLDAVCSHMWEVVPGVDPADGRGQIPGRIEQYEGSYAAYILARAQRAQEAAVVEQKRRNLVRKELAWLRRGAPARTSKPRFHVKRAEALIEDVPPPRDGVELLKMATARLGKKVIDLVDVCVSFQREGESAHQVLNKVTWRIAPGERVGIIGVNGAGKTTLLRVICEELSPESGRVTTGKTVQIAKLSQSTHELDDLGDKRVVEAVAMVKERMVVGDKEMSAMQMVERLGFTKKRAWTPVKDISGGERRRLQLLRLLMSEPNVLVLDEPTNDLDTDTLAALEDLLDSYSGTLIVVSHDRYLLERVTDHQRALTADGGLQLLPGGIEQYLRERSASRTQTSGRFTGKITDVKHDHHNKEGGMSGTFHRGGGQGNDIAAHNVPSGAALYEMTKQLSALERKMKKCEDKITALEQEMAILATDPSAENIKQLAHIDKQVAQLRADHDDLETQWLELSEEIDG
ncbi:MAG: ABC-F family ATP-binding cassette domain-containing protein [Actinomycetaceae bacterium]|nr:ABC-F family ATP-binding cassette domain-containing protein [Actinomycetaceae bacterium]